MRAATHAVKIENTVTFASRKQATELGMQARREGKVAFVYPIAIAKQLGLV